METTLCLQSCFLLLPCALSLFKLPLPQGWRPSQALCGCVARDPEGRSHRTGVLSLIGFLRQGRPNLQARWTSGHSGLLHLPSPGLHHVGTVGEWSLSKHRWNFSFL